MSEHEMKRSKKNQLSVKISTYDADVEFDVKPKCTGQDVFNLACVTFGIRETWYFGLQFNDTSSGGAVGGGAGGVATSGGSWWLRPDRRLSEVVRSLPAGCPLHFLFHVRFWVEDVGEDLLLEATVHLFYLEVKDLVLTRQQWAASPDLLPLLAAYAAQAELGDFDPAVGCDHLLSRLLPVQAKQSESAAAACAEKLRDHYRDLAGLGRTEAQIEMLRLAQDLDMFGLVYFPIHANGPASDPGSWLGISCYGVSFYEQASLVKPYRRLGWPEIRRMSCRDRKFSLIVNDAPSASSAGSAVDEPPTCFGGEHRGGRAVTFWTRSPADSKQILRLCVGNHELFMARRMPDSIERQQMRATAREERARRLLDKQRLAREVEGRAAAERQRGAAEEKAGQLGQLLAKSEAMLGLLSERARLAEDEMRLLTEQRDRQLAHMRLIHSQLLAEKQSLAERARQFESLLLALSEEASVNEAERDCLRQQLAYARQGEKSLLAKLEGLLRSVGVWSSAGASDSSGDLLPLGSLPAGAGETEETSGLSTAELLARLQAERQQFADSSAAFEADLRQLRSRVQATRMGGAAASVVDPCLVTHSTAVSCPHSSPGNNNRLGRLSNGSRAAVTYFDEL